MTATKVVNAAVRWHTRQATRYYGEDVREVLDDDNSLNVGYQLGVRAPTESEDRTTIVIRMRAEVNDTQFHGHIDLEVKFLFEDTVSLEDLGNGKAFADQYGFDYVLGYLRSGMAEASRSVGLRSRTIPLQAIDALRESDTEDSSTE